MEANESKLIRPHFKVVEIVDGDGLIVENIFTKEQEEVRIYGIDAPELKPSNKLLKDERVLNLSAEFFTRTWKQIFELYDPSSSTRRQSYFGSRKKKYG
jgi:endonuclease YncB( thermonuclease family)